MNQEAGRMGVLYVDDTVRKLDDFKTLFCQHSFDVFTAPSITMAYRLMARNEIGVIIANHLMPDTTGNEFFETVARMYPRTIRILLTGFSDNHVVEAINNGLIYECLPKPWQNQELKNVIKNAVEVYHLRKQNMELTYKLYEANYAIEKNKVQG